MFVERMCLKVDFGYGYWGEKRIVGRNKSRNSSKKYKKMRNQNLDMKLYFLNYRAFYTVRFLMRRSRAVMKLDLHGIADRSLWEEKGYQLPQYNIEKMVAATKEAPFWIHFGAGNLFRAFHARIAEGLLNKGILDRGMIVVEGFDYEIVEKCYFPHDNLGIAVTLKADGTIEKNVIASVAEALSLDSNKEAYFGRLKAIFAKDSLQMATFTITEKGYSLVDGEGNLLPEVVADFENGPERPKSYLGKVTALLYARYQAGEKPIAMVSTDNCSHNGDRLYEAIFAFAKAWEKNGKVEIGFAGYIDSEQVSFPWTMIDKITPRPDTEVEAMLRKDGVEEMEPVITSKYTHTALFVNAEETEYLVVEDDFPNGRPELEKGGIIFTERAVVEKAEKMKVCTCLNPLHTTLAVFGCLLGYKKISEEMQDQELRKLVYRIGYEEDLPVVVNPGILNPKKFLDTVLQVRLPNPFMPDTPQRIATDTSQKLAIRFGETIKAYMKREDLDANQIEGNQMKVNQLEMIPLVFAGWLRYLIAVDDEENAFALSPDPMLDCICPHVQGFQSKVKNNAENEEILEVAIESALKPILENKSIFGVNLYEVGLAEKVCRYFKEMLEGPGAVRAVLKKYVNKEEGCMVSEKIQEMGVVPVVVLHDAKDARPLAKALCDGGLPCAEVTFRTDAAEEAIRIMTEEFPEMLVGAGTVLTIEQVERAVASGARFIISPGFNPEIVDYCCSKQIPVYPGCITPTEVAQAVKRGLKIVKFFPAETFGGIATIKALAAPYTDVIFMPTGGINAKNLKEYLSCDKIVACGGSWMVKENLLKEGRFDEIKKLTEEAVRLVREIRILDKK